MAAGDKRLMPLVAGGVEHDDEDRPKRRGLDRGQAGPGAREEEGEDAILDRMGNNALRLEQGGRPKREVAARGQKIDHAHPGDGRQPASEPFMPR